MNHVSLVGRLVADPELRFLPGNGTATTAVTLAVDNPFRKDASGKATADFIPVVFWGKQAESLATYTAKGSLIAIGGRIQTRSYDAKDGTKRYVTEVVANDLQFLSKKAEPSAAPQQQYNNNDFGDMTPIDDGEIPF